jgi:transcriptional regulator GlxA family with amidase domain
MKHISIVVPDGQANLSTVACIVGAYEILTTANALWGKSGSKQGYAIELVGASKESEIHDGMLTIKAHANVADVAQTNLIIIPSLAKDYQEAMNGNRQLVDWIAWQYKHGAEIASMCTGTFMLAAAGLLDGKNCSTHWSAAAAFRNFFPKVNLQTDRLITDENGIYTNGGAYSFLNLVIYLVEKYFDRQTAIHCSKIFQVEIDRQSQSAFAIFSGQKLHDDQMVQQAQAYIEQHMEQKMTIGDLSAKFNTGRRNFDRRFIKATGNTPLEYAQRVKIEAAKRSFETNRKTITEVMYEVGYSDVKAFREVFRKITGIAPLEYKAKYYKDAPLLGRNGA